MKTKDIHYNIPQLRSMVVDAPNEVGIFSRGTGKTVGLIAPKSIRQLTSMPRSTGVFVARTFTQMLERTLPPVIQGWEKLGYIKDVHYTIGREPSAKWKKQFNWQGPLQVPVKFDHTICWFNGSTQQLISQERSGGANGISIDYIDGDEARILNYQRLDEELVPANRGVIPAFADNPHHHGMTFTTDMPRGTAGKWLLDLKEENNPSLIAVVVKIATEIFKLEQKYYASKSTRLRTSLSKKIAHLKAYNNKLRRGMFYYHEASALDNIHALGIDYIRLMERKLKPFEFKTSILNIKTGPEDGFYPALNEELHGYFSYDYHHTFEKHGYNFDKLLSIKDCRRDGDIDPNRSLHIGMDYNKSIWPIVTGQVHGNELRVLSGKHVLAPKGLRDAINLWAEYYRPHKKKVVYFWYDQTALGETRSPIADDVEEYLVANGWTVIRRYFGGAPQHEAKYRFIDDLLQYKFEDKFITINRDNCNKLLISLSSAEAMNRTKDGFGKDKSQEKDKEADQSETTHYSDAFDTLLWGVFKSGKSHSENEEELPQWRVS